MMKSTYGFSKGNGYFKGKSNEDIAKEISDADIGSIFGGHEEKELLDALHKHNIKVYAEIGIFYDREQWKEHPEYRPLNSNGEYFTDDWSSALCPNQDELRKFKLASIEKLFRSYEIDGVWLDFIRYPLRWEKPELNFEETCFCPACINKFGNASGLELNPADAKESAGIILSKHEREWREFKTNSIADFVRQSYLLVKSIRKDALNSMFSVPMLPSHYGNAVEKIVGQDFKKLSCFIDVFSPMTYHQMRGQPLDWISEITDGMKEITGGTICPIIQSMDISAEEFEKAIKQALSGKSDGVMVFTLDDAINGGKFPVLKKALK